MTRTPAAIETRYAGCRFRSRLEARWAVFLDKLGVTWEYEPEGFELSPGRRYLPDFWLPGLNLWIEVKGDESGINRDLVNEAAQDLPGLGLMILGPLPRPTDSAIGHTLLHRGPRLWGVFEVTELAVKDDRAIPRHSVLATECHEPMLLTSYRRIPDAYRCPFVAGAYGAARSARFEHGESG